MPSATHAPIALFVADGFFPNGTPRKMKRVKILAAKGRFVSVRIVASGAVLTVPIYCIYNARGEAVFASDLTIVKS